MENSQSHIFSVVDSIDNEDQLHPLHPSTSIQKSNESKCLEEEMQVIENNGVDESSVNDNGEILREIFSLDLDELFDANANTLPPRWVKINHISGFPIYMQEGTSVCTLTRPYYIGPGSTKSHTIPECAIPCLWYNTLLEKSEEEGECHKSYDTKESTNADSTSKVRQNHKKVLSYCKKRLFKFRTIKYRIFKSWEVRRSFERTSKVEKCHKRGIYRFAHAKRGVEGKGEKSAVKKKVKFNPADFKGKSYVAVLHEFMQQMYKVQPVYTYKELDNAKTPYSSTTIINNSEYGTGVGISKKEAKVQAAKATLEILNPDILLQVDGSIEEDTTNEKRDVVKVFNNIPVTDHRVSLLCNNVTVPTPYEILETCLNRRYNSKVNIDIEMNEDRCTVRCADLSATVICNNKREGKQKSCQVLLQQLHPFIENWGALLRLYGCKGSVDEKEFKRLTREDDDSVEEEDNTIHPVNPKLIAMVRKYMIQFRKKKGEDVSDVSDQVSSESEDDYLSDYDSSYSDE